MRVVRDELNATFKDKQRAQFDHALQLAALADAAVAQKPKRDAAAAKAAAPPAGAASSAGEAEARPLSRQQRRAEERRRRKAERRGREVSAVRFFPGGSRKASQARTSCRCSRSHDDDRFLGPGVTLPWRDSPLHNLRRPRGTKPAYHLIRCRLMGDQRMVQTRGPHCSL